MSLDSRRYMSKRDRPCDFCRSRKSACCIDAGPPCQLCAVRGRRCTFDKAPPSRKKVHPTRRGAHTAPQDFTTLESNGNGLIEALAMGQDPKRSDRQWNNLPPQSPTMDTLTQDTLDDMFLNEDDLQPWGRFKTPSTTTLLFNLGILACHLSQISAFQYTPLKLLLLLQVQAHQRTCSTLKGSHATGRLYLTLLFSGCSSTKL